MNFSKFTLKLIELFALLAGEYIDLFVHQAYQSLEMLLGEDDVLDFAYNQRFEPRGI